LSFHSESIEAMAATLWPPSSGASRFPKLSHFGKPIWN
jgi:hypothetical protein